MILKEFVIAEFDKAGDKAMGRYLPFFAAGLADGIPVAAVAGGDVAAVIRAAFEAVGGGGLSLALPFVPVLAACTVAALATATDGGEDVSGIVTVMREVCAEEKLYFQAERAPVFAGVMLAAVKWFLNKK